MFYLNSGKLNILRCVAGSKALFFVNHHFKITLQNHQSIKQNLDRILHSIHFIFHALKGLETQLHLKGVWLAVLTHATNLLDRLPDVFIQKMVAFAHEQLRF